MDKCPDDIFSAYLINIFDLTDIYRHTLIMSKSYSCLIHDSDISLDDFVEIQRVMPYGISMLLRIFIIDPIDFRRFHDDITVEFEGPQYSTRISREIRIPCASHTYHDSSLLDVPEGSSADEFFCYSLSWYGTRHSDIDSLIFYCFSYSKTIDDRPHHSHIVACHSIESSLLELYASENIASSHNNDYFEFLDFDQVYYFLCKKREKFRINTISLLSLESFSGKLQKDTFGCMIFLHIF